MARILICDDSDLIRKIITDILTRDNHEIVGIACDGDQAVNQYVQLKPDLVTMDIMMEPDGVEAISRIRKVDPEAKIIIISDLESCQAKVIQGIYMGAKGYIGKPIKEKVLLDEVKRVLGRYSQFEKEI